MFFRQLHLIGKRTQGVAIAILLASGVLASEQELVPFRVGVSHMILPDVRESDVAASVKVWGDAVFSAHNIRREVVPATFSDAEEMRRALRNEEVDLAIIRAKELFALEAELSLDRILFYSKRGKTTTEYLLLTKRDGGMDSLADLEGKSIVFAEHAWLGMGHMWLETLLLEKTGRIPAGYFGFVSGKSKTLNAALGVFLGQADACVVTRNSMEIIEELNPQIGLSLQEVEVSPAFVPALICPRKSLSIDRMDELYNAVVDMHKDPQGAQILTVFKVDRLVAGSVEQLATTREWHERHAALKARVGSGDARVPEVGP
ncbi:MAG: PhnD/SsuA/transferrin family substrate-binding protein [Verrucomicrobiota bacterium]